MQLEHLSLDDFRIALQNTYVYLKQGGRFRFVLPDLEALARDYLTSDKPDAAMHFMQDTYLGYKSRQRGLKGFLETWLGNASHCWMWNMKSIQKQLAEAGFVNIRRAHFGDSGDAMFELVEERSRWDTHLGVDCQRPAIVASSATSSASGAA